MSRHVRPALWSALWAVAIGATLGGGTVAGIRRRAAAGPIYPKSYVQTDPAWSGPAPDCAGCTRYDEGYRWASMRRVDNADSCANDDWSYQRGCMAYLYGTRTD